MEEGKKVTKKYKNNAKKYIKARIEVKRQKTNKKTRERKKHLHTQMKRREKESESRKGEKRNKVQKLDNQLEE